MRILLITACAAAMAAGQVSAQPAEPLSYVEDGKHIYLPGYFERFAPQTAADMVFNLPGFQVRQASQAVLEVLLGLLLPCLDLR